MAGETTHGMHGGGEHGDAHAHPSVGAYWMVAAVLAILTALEVAVFYIPALDPVLVPVLLVLTAGKFGLVVMFYMHLRTDSRVFTGLFMAGMILASFMIIALIVLYHYLPTLGEVGGAGLPI